MVPASKFASGVVSFPTTPTKDKCLPSAPSSIHVPYTSDASVGITSGTHTALYAVLKNPSLSGTLEIAFSITFAALPVNICPDE